MEPGDLVEFFEEKRIICAFVLERKGERLHVLTQAGREMTIAGKRLIYTNPTGLRPQQPRQELLEALRVAAQKRETYKESINLEELWELLAQENQPLSVEDMAELWFGAPSLDQVAALGRTLHEDRLLFKYKEGLWVPNSPEAVEILKERDQREAERLKELETAAGMLREAWEKGDIADPARRARLVELLRQMAVWGPEAPDYALGKVYLDKAQLPGEDAPFRLLVRLKEFQEDENLDLYRLEVPLKFSPETLSLARRLSLNRPPDPYASGRQDLTGLACLTIDGERTRDFDDALSLEAAPEGWRLGIHIADVTSAVLPGEILDLEACQRGTSIYLPERRLPMLPEEISEETLSLVASQPRPVLSFLVTLTSDAEVKDWTICPGSIKVRRRLTYHEVDQLLPQDPELAALAALSQRLKERRLAQGGYELRFPEVWVSLNEQGEVLVNLEDQGTQSHSLVSETMILANWLAAQFLADHGLPAIYRTQAEPREPMRGHDSKSLLQLWQDRRRLSRVVMDLEPKPHWGLGLPLYTLATSPIRRYLDLVTHRQILGTLADRGPFYSRDELSQLITLIDPAMRRAGLLKARRLRYWLLKYLARRVGQKMEALVLENLPNRHRLLLTDLLLEAFLTTPASHTLSPGDTVLVRLDRALPREDQIKLSLA